MTGCSANESGSRTPSAIRSQAVAGPAILALRRMRNRMTSLAASWQRQHLAMHIWTIMEYIYIYIHMYIYVYPWAGVWNVILPIFNWKIDRKRESHSGCDTSQPPVWMLLSFPKEHAMTNHQYHLLVFARLRVGYLVFVCFCMFLSESLTLKIGWWIPLSTTQFLNLWRLWALSSFQVSSSDPGPRCSKHLQAVCPTTIDVSPNQTCLSKSVSPCSPAWRYFCCQNITKHHRSRFCWHLAAVLMAYPWLSHDFFWGSYVYSLQYTVYLVGGLELCLFFHLLGIISQVTNIFHRGRVLPTTRYCTYRSHRSDYYEDTPKSQRIGESGLAHWLRPSGQRLHNYGKIHPF